MKGFLPLRQNGIFSPAKIAYQNTLAFLKLKENSSMEPQIVMPLIFLGIFCFGWLVTTYNKFIESAVKPLPSGRGYKALGR